MLIKLLPESEREHLIELAKLLALSDNPLLWDGKTADEFTSSTNLNALAIQKSEQEQALIEDLEQSVGSRSVWYSSTVEERLVEELKAFPIPKVEQPENRIQAATVVLKELLKTLEPETPATPKIMLFELLLVALRDGHISNIEWLLLKTFQQHFRLEDFIFDDLLERAETLNLEVSKTISIVLE